MSSAASQYIGTRSALHVYWEGIDSEAARSRAAQRWRSKRVCSRCAILGGRGHGEGGPSRPTPLGSMPEQFW
eukprot:5678389-Prorocentrum_lima.AAC.1